MVQVNKISIWRSIDLVSSTEHRARAPRPIEARGETDTERSWHYSTMALKKLAIAVLLPILSQVLSSEALATASNVAKSASASKILRSSRDYHLLEVVPHDTSSFTCVSIQLYYVAAFGVLVFLLTHHEYIISSIFLSTSQSRTNLL